MIHNSTLYCKIFHGNNKEPCSKLYLLQQSFGEIANFAIIALAIFLFKCLIVLYYTQKRNFNKMISLLLSLLLLEYGNIKTCELSLSVSGSCSVQYHTTTKNYSLTVLEVRHLNQDTIKIVSFPFKLISFYLIKLNI